MKLAKLVETGKLVECACAICRARTLLDPDFYLLRRGDIELECLKRGTVCGGCGSPDIELIVREPQPVVEIELGS